MATEKSKTFSEEYSKLKKIENEINQMEDKDIDKLNSLVESAMKSAEFCEDRIKKIKDSLEDTIK